jgi:hypothetical protein
MPNIAVVLALLVPLLMIGDQALSSSTAARAQGPVLAYEDNLYQDWNGDEDDNDDEAYSDDGDEPDDDDGDDDSAHGPDDDEGWDVEEGMRSVSA